MKGKFLIVALFFTSIIATAQNVGIVRKNYFSSVYDSALMQTIDVLDSSTIRLGSVNPATGVVSNVGAEYNMGINLNGVAINPYANRYYIGSGTNFLTFDMNSGNIISNVAVYGSLSSNSFQNFRFNQSDSTIYGMVPVNFYSSYFDSSVMSSIEVLDSTQIRFASLNPNTGQYTVIGSTSFTDLYTLAGNSIDPYQMLYYYSAVDTLVGIDLYTGAKYSAVPIQLPSNGIFENIAYSCADTAIYGISRFNYRSRVYDSLAMDSIDVYDSTTFRLSKINPNTGAITFVSPYNIAAGGNLTGGAFIDPNAMVYYFSNGNQIVGVSLTTGLITSSVTKSFSGGAFALDMMRSTQNCYDATAIRIRFETNLEDVNAPLNQVIVFPNPAQNSIEIKTEASFSHIEILDYKGSVVLVANEKTIDVSNLPSGFYVAKLISNNGAVVMGKFVKD